MLYKIIGDSCSDFTPEMWESPAFASVPLVLELGTYSVVDDKSFRQREFLDRVAASPVGPKTACPSPEAYQRAIEESNAEEVYIVTLSEHLSGSYQSAVVGLQLFEEAHPDRMGKKIHVFGSDSASAGQCNLCLEIRERKENGESFEELVQNVTEKIHRMQTYFVLESLETLRKNGRLSAVKSFLASALNIKPVMGAMNGIIVQLDRQRGMNKALRRMAELAVERAGGAEATKALRVVITHVDAPERAEFVKQELLRIATFRELIVTNAQGVATVYANDQGIVIAL